MSNINIPTQVSPFDNATQFPAIGKIRVIYIDKATDTAYYWNDDTSAYVSLGGGASAINWGDIGGNILDQTDLQSALSGKVDTEAGKGLSTNDYTTTEKNKLAGIQAGAEVNVNADWNASSGDAQILNKPTIPDVSGLATVVYVDAQDALKMDKSVYDPTESGRVNTARWVEIDVINNTGSSIPKMAVVYFNTSSSSADTPEILLANANSEATSSKTMGLTKDVIANGATGKVILEGEYNLFNTSAYSVGARLWLSTTAGQITTTPPTPPNHAVFLGIVSRSQATNGRICIKIQNGYELDELHDVTATDYSDPQDVDSLLIRDNATSLWKRLTWANVKAKLKTYFDTVYQSILVSGTNIKTINSTSVLGSGNISVQPTLISGTNIKTINGTTLLGSGDLTISGGTGLKGVHAVIQPKTGTAILPVVNGTNTSNVGVFNGRLIAYPFIPATSFTSTGVSINIFSAVAGGLGRISMYDDLNGKPNNVIFTTPDLDCSTTGLKTFAISNSFVAGTTYWLCTHFNNLTNQATAVTASSMLPVASSAVAATLGYGYYQSVAFTTIPSPFTGTTLLTGSSPLIFIQV